MIASLLVDGDPPGLDALMSRLGSDLTVKLERVRAIMHEELGVAPHDVQVYWLGECNCDGHLN